MTKTVDPKTPHYAGHRDRLRDRFLHSGAEALSDYELLELVLFMAIPRRDIKPLAKDLIRQFGSFGAVISADTGELTETGLSETAVAALKAVQAAALRLAREEVMEKPVLNTWKRLLDYCRAAMAREKKEQFRLLFLDRKNTLIGEEIHQQGTVDHTPAYPREIIKSALDIGATAIVLVHNHPSGDPEPSKTDIQMTRDIIRAAEAVGIVIHDHLIIARHGHASFKALGLM